MVPRVPSSGTRSRLQPSHDERDSASFRGGSTASPAIRAKAWRRRPRGLVGAPRLRRQLRRTFWACVVGRRRDRTLWASVAFLLAEGVGLLVGRGNCPVGAAPGRMGRSRAVLRAGPATACSEGGGPRPCRGQPRGHRWAARPATGSRGSRIGPQIVYPRRARRGITPGGIAREEPTHPHRDHRLLRSTRGIRVPVLRAAGPRLRLVRRARRPAGLRARRAVGLARRGHGDHLDPRGPWPVGAPAVGAPLRPDHGRLRPVRGGPGLLPVPGHRRRVGDGDHAGIHPVVPEHERCQGGVRAW